MLKLKILMNKNIYKLLLVSVLSVIGFAGCQTGLGGNYSNTTKGLGLGTAIGSSVGAIIGRQSGETGAGALIIYAQICQLCE